MEEKEFTDLAKMNDVFDNKTLRYRINGFARACNMQDIGVLGNSGVLFNTSGFKDAFTHNKDEEGYFIAVNQNDTPIGKTVTLNGHYNDLSFTFTNYYKNEKLDKKIIDLPFTITLVKKVNQETYHISIETIEKSRTKISLYKSCELKDRTFYDNVEFYTNIEDFSKVLKLVKSFVYNPVLVFNTYNEIGLKHKIVYATKEFERATMQDERLDKPTSKVKKYLKKRLGLN